MQFNNSFRKRTKFFIEIYSIVRAYIRQVREGELRLVAASLAYSTMLSLVPFLAVSLVVFHWFGGPQDLFPKIEKVFLDYFREAIGNEFGKIIRASVKNIHAGALGTTSIFFLIVTSIRLIQFMEFGVHRVWNIPLRRPLIKRIFVSWILILIWPLLAALYVGFLSISEVRAVTEIIPSFLINGSLVIGGLFCVYKFVPDIHVRSLYALLAALLAGIGLKILQVAFTILTVRVFNYSKVYGGFAAFPLFLVFILCFWYVIFCGVAICATLQKKKDKDEKASLRRVPANRPR